MFGERIAERLEQVLTALRRVVNKFFLPILGSLLLDKGLLSIETLPEGILLILNRVIPYDNMRLKATKITNA